MANVLAWLTGREDRTVDPAPVQVGQPELRSYSPSPSERFGNWISDALGAGQGASLAHQNFAKGVPSVLSLFPPLGVGLSALDYAHARATDNPGAAAAAAIGMVPGAGKLAPGAKGVAKSATDEAGQLIKQIEEGLFGPSAGTFIPPKPVSIPGTNPAMAKGGDPNAALAAIEEVLGKQAPKGLNVVQESPTQVLIADKYGHAWIDKSKVENVGGQWQFTKAPAQAPANYEVAPGVYAPVSNPVKSPQGNLLPPIASGNPLKAVTETPFEIAVQDPGSKMYSWHEKANLVKKGDQWFAKEGYDPAKNVPPAWVEPKAPVKAPSGLTEQDFADAINASGTHHIDPKTGKTVANLPSKEGYTLSSAANKAIPESAKDYYIHDPAGNKVGELTHSPEEIHDEHSSTPANWQLSMEGVAPKSGTSLEDLMGYIPGWHKQTLTKAAPAITPKPVFDYEKDDTGLYHVFDAKSGKTHTVVDSEQQAKQWINEQIGFKPEPFNFSASSAKTIPITESPSVPWKAKDYSNSQVFGNLGIFPQEVPFKLPERAIAQGYVTPAVHGTMSQEWSTPTKAGIGEIGDALRLPSDELGVHFGTPDQAQHFTGREINNQVLPRTYPTALQTGKSLELPDTGTWHVSDIKKALGQLHTGDPSKVINADRFPMTNVEQYAGKFPREELNDISTIEEMRQYLREKGYNSVNYINAVEGPGQRSHIMFNPSPESPNYVAGVRSPFAAFDPSKMMRPELGLSIMGMLGLGAVAAPTKSEAKGASK